MKLSFSATIFLGLLVFSLIVGQAVPSSVAAATEAATEVNYVSDINYTLEQPFGGQRVITGPAQYLQLVYQFALGIVGIIATVLIMVGGVQWIGAAGNESIIGSAKELIVSAVTGLVIALLSYVILLIINPQLVNITFNLEKIAIPNSSQLWNYDWCTASSLADKICRDSNSGTGACKEVACGLSGSYDGEGCRGQACAASNEKCYHDIDNPQERAACAPVDCGSWTDMCYKAYPDPSQSADYHGCLCDYYQAKVMPTFGAPLYGIGKTPSDYTADQNTMFDAFCDETTTQTDWLSKITTTTPYSTTLVGAPSLAAQKTYNCGFSCNAVDTAVTQYTGPSDYLDLTPTTAVLKTCLPVSF